MSLTASLPATLSDPAFLQSVAEKVGTPFWLLDARVIRRRIADVQALVEGEGFQARYAMKANPNAAILQLMREHGIWIDAVSANECARAQRAGYPGGSHPPAILFTADVFRDAWQPVVLEEDILPNLGSPGMLRDLAEAGYQGPIALRVNVGFGHGHVNTCDTGGPSSKHGIWWESLGEVRAEAARLGLPIVMLHAHVGSGPQQAELRENLAKLGRFFAEQIVDFSDVQAVSLGGGLPWNYRMDEPLEIPQLRAILTEARETIMKAAGRPIRLEIEPGRYYVVSAGTLVTRVTDVKETQTNEKGQGETFIMVDAGFTDLIRPAMYGSHHHISIPAREGQPVAPMCVAGPLCESGDVFTRGADELLEPRALPRPEAGDLLCFHDGGAYGYSMASQYNSLGRAPQVWIENDEEIRLVSRRENLDDLLRIETDQPLAL